MTTYPLFFQRKSVSKPTHYESNGSREKGEHRPYHSLDRLFISDGDDGLASYHISGGYETSHAEQCSNERTGYCSAEFLRHSAGGEDKSGGGIAEFLSGEVSHVSIHGPQERRVESGSY